MISITWVSRNDNHGNHLLLRIQAAVDALQFYRDTGLDIELIFVEWNPPGKNPHLYDVIEFDNNFPVRWYIVPNHIHKSLPNSDILDIYPHIGANVGMRRARGDWLLTTTHDCILSSRLALELRYLHNDTLFYRVPREDAESGLPDEMSTIERIHYMDGHLTGRRTVWKKGIFTRSCGDFILCHKDVWRDLRGYPEWAMNGIWLDGLFLSRLIAHGIAQHVYPYPIYHMEHDRKGLDIYKEQPHMPRHVYKRMADAMRRRQDPFTINNTHWGMADLHERKIHDNIWILEGTHKNDPIGWKKVDKLLSPR